MFVIYHFQVQMGKKKKKNLDAKKTPDAKCSCLLIDGEEYTLLVPYLKGLASDIISMELPRGELHSPADMPGMLIPTAKKVFFRVIQMVTRETENGLYFQTISESNIIMTDSDLPKIAVNTVKVVNKIEPEGSNEKKDTIRKLGHMLDRVLQASSALYMANRRVDPELSHLLGLLRNYQAGRCLLQIKYHFCLIPLSNRGSAYIQLYDHTMDVLRFTDPEAYVLVVMNVEIPDNWDTECLGNEFLADSLRRGDYDLKATRCPTITEPRLIPFKYLRNRPSHAQEGAAAPLAPRGVRFSPSDLARAMYIRMPLAFVSLQKSLHFVGALHNIPGIIDLFPGRLRIPRNN